MMWIILGNNASQQIKYKTYLKYKEMQLIF